MNDGMTPRQIIVDFVLEQIEAQPLEKRTLLYRALAADLGRDDEVGKTARALADECESISRRHCQLHLNFRRAVC